MSVPTTNATTAAAPTVIEDAPWRGTRLARVTAGGGALIFAGFVATLRVLRASDGEWDDGRPA
jgi:hypothetical protein